MHRLEDIHDINQLMYRFVDAHDNLDRALMVSLAVPEGPVTFDLSKHMGGEPMEMSPSEFAGRAIRSAAGFTATHHILAHPTVDFDKDDKDKARARMIGIAYHCVEEGEGEGRTLETVTGMAYQTMNVERWDGEWKFRTLAIERNYPMDNPGLYRKARERFEKGLGREPKAVENGLSSVQVKHQEF